MPKIYRVRLTEFERDDLLSRQRKGSSKSARYRAASILLLADENAPEGPLADTAIARAVHATVRTVERIRERAVRADQLSCLDRRHYLENNLELPDAVCRTPL